jgi:hypothetical protein
MIEVIQPEPRADSQGFPVTVKSQTAIYSASAGQLVEVQQAIPHSFLSAIADYQRGRVIDAEQALSDQPPPESV